ncbi:MAG: MotA/TolQ/ExbB proton channel family protein [Alphaproteobacteria bacterium]|nr:MotA/TolQ/ExbB proton channel family protein [Alphaproteobacteria bacterium]
MLDAIADAFSGPGAAFMYAITAVLALALAIGLERGFLYWLSWRADRDAVLDKLRQHDVAGAIQAAGAHPGASLLRAGADAASADAAWDAMGAQAALVQEEVRRRVAWLATAGNIATMLGLLGTIYGLIFAFQGLTDASTVERATRISDGIATAMVTTAWGLIVGIPALAAHALVDGKARRELAFIEAAAGLLAASLRPGRKG